MASIRRGLIPLLTTACLCVSGSFGQSPMRYLDKQLTTAPLLISICPSDAGSRASSIALIRPDQPFNPINFALPVGFTISVNNTPSCVNSNDRYAIFLNFRSFQLNAAGLPAYSVSIDYPSDLGMALKRPDMTQVDYSKPEFQTEPRSEVQFLSKFEREPSLTVDVKVEQRDWSTVDWSAVVIDYVLLSENVSHVDPDRLVECEVLQGAFVPKDVYCLAWGHNETFCPESCYRATSSLHYSQATEFDAHSFSYGSCGRERVPSKCGEQSDPRPKPHKVNFLFGWDVLGGIIAGGIVLFVVFPLTILCIGYYRRKR